MSKVLTNNQYYSQIANIIREQNGTNNTYKPAQMVRALKDLFYEEVEEVPPITFQGIGENLLDYRIDGASGGVGERTKNLFNFNEWSENLTANENNELIISNNSITITAVGNDTFTVPYYVNHPNIYKIGVLPNSQYVLSWDSNNTLPGAIYVFKNGLMGSGNYVRVNNATRKYITFSTDGNTTFITIRFGVMNAGDSITYSHIQLEEGSTATDYEIYGYKVPVVVSGKNLFDEENAVDTDYYITNAGQEVVGANGDKFLKSYINVKPSTQYTFKWSQTIMGSADNTPYIRISEYTSNNTFIQRLLCQCSAQSQNNYTFTTSNNTVYIDIRIDSETSTRGQHLTGIMLVKGATAPDTYEEYTATTTNIYINEPIEANESISLSDTNVNIPTIRGTNVLTVDTTVQPSKVYVKARKESPYEIAMRQNYEEQLSAIETALQEV